MPSRPVSEATIRRRALGRVRAARWRERHAAEVSGLQSAAATASIDAAVVTSLIQLHVARREVTGARDVPLPLRDVVRAARDMLVSSGMSLEDANAAIRDRLRAGTAKPSAEANVLVPGQGQGLAA